MPDYTDFQENGKYTWVKAPRYDQKPMQVGPLSQVLVGYAQGHPLTKKWTDLALAKISAIGKRKVTVNDLQSTMGRHVARAIRCAMLSELATKHWEYLVGNISHGDTATYNPPKFPDGEVRGRGNARSSARHAVPLGGREERDASPTTRRSFRPRGTPARATKRAIPDRTKRRCSATRSPTRRSRWKSCAPCTRSIPCMACACHTFDPEGKPIATVKVL